MASNGTKISPSDAMGAGEDMTWLKEEALNIVVVGASGDLAKKKTFPSLVTCCLFPHPFGVMLVLTLRTMTSAVESGPISRNRAITAMK
jgi:hypothetical protein